MTNNKGLYICKLRSKKDGFEQEFQGSGQALKDFEEKAEKQNYTVVFHRRLT